MQQILAKDIAKNQSVLPETLAILELSDVTYDTADGEPSIDVKISAKTYTGVNPSIVREIVRGKSDTYALEALEAELPLERIVRIDISPAWLHRFPLLDMQIHIRYPWESDS